MGGESSKFDTSSKAYHILKVQENSPGYRAGLVPFFDYIISVENTRLDEDNGQLNSILNLNIEMPVELLVYNVKTNSIRSLNIVPSLNWGGEGLLGIYIRFCSLDGANENVWHILEVQTRSPAFKAGLIPQADYIVGTETFLEQAEEFFSLIENNDKKTIKLFVYNKTNDKTREVLLTPDSDWGGEGMIGCEIGYGYLHKIPISNSSQDMSPGSLNPTKLSSRGEEMGARQFPSNVSQSSSLLSTIYNSNAYSISSLQNECPSSMFYVSPNMQISSQTCPASDVQTQNLTYSMPDASVNKNIFVNTPLYVPGLPPISVTTPLISSEAGSIPTFSNDMLLRENVTSNECNALNIG